MAVAEVGWKSGWELEYVGASAVVEWEEETRKRERVGEAVAETWTLDVPYDVLELIVKQLDDDELAWVRRVCRGMCAAVARVHAVRHAGKEQVPRVMLTQAGAGRGVGRMREALAKWTKPKSKWRRRKACLMAAEAGCLEALMVARENGCKWDSGTCALAAWNGHLAVMQWARTNGCDWDLWPCAYAARGGHLAVLQWARENGCNWDWRTCAWAAENGHLAVLQWARANGCEWDSDTCAYAARNGHLAVLKWARENGCNWDWRTCAYAAQNGHLAVLQWARVNGCDWDSDTCIYAAQNGHTHVLEWVHDRPVEEWPCAEKGGCGWAGVGARARAGVGSVTSNGAE